MLKLAVKLGTLIILLTTVVFAQTISVQGVLRDPQGKTVEEGYYSLTLKLYEQETGGVAIWEEYQSSVYTAHGVFNLELGSVNPLAGVPFNMDYYLGISVENDPEMQPRLKFLKAPAAMSVLGAYNTVPSQGNVGIGTSDPQAGLHIVTYDANDDLLKIESENGGGFKVTADGDFYLESNGALRFEDGSRLVSSYFGGTAEELRSYSDAIITVDADGDGDGSLKIYSGDSLQMEVGNNGVTISDMTDYGSPVGSMMMFTGSTIPTGWLLCDGSAYSTTEYAKLYAVIGPSYGYGSGTFCVPDMRGKVAAGYNVSNAKFNALGETGGAETHTLTQNEMPSHYHSVNPPNKTSTTSSSSHSHTVDPPSTNTTSGGAHTHTTAIGTDSWDAGDYNGLDDDDGSGSMDHTSNSAGSHSHSVDISSFTSGSAGSHAHSVNIGSFNSGSKGSGAAHNILQPYVTVNYIIKY